MQTDEATGQQIDQLATDLRSREAELEELRRVSAQDPESNAAKMLERELSRRRSRYRRDVSKLVQLVLEGPNAGVDVSGGRLAATEILRNDARTLRANLEKISAQVLDLIDLAERGSAEESEKARSKLASELPRADRLTNYVEANISQRKQLDLDVEADTRQFMTGIQLRADFTASVLQSAKESIDDIAGRPGADKDPQAQRELAALRKARDVLAKSQRLNVRLMDNYGIETAELRGGIIIATGKLSQDILNKDVASGLFNEWIDDTGDWLASNGLSLVFQTLTLVLVLLAFWILSRIGGGAVRRGVERSKLDVSSLARDFLVRMTGRLIMLFGVIIAVAQIGIEVGALLAGVGIAGLVIGFALQDTLSNFASGLMILIYRPFDVGDWIEAGGVTGRVKEMSLVSTQVLTGDNQLHIVPNRQVWGGVIRNITHQDKRRVDMTFGIGYADDIPKAEKVLTEILTTHDKVLQDPEPVVRLHELGDSSVNFVVRPWAKTGEYWDVYWDVTRQVKRHFDKEGISIPFPQRDVHIYHEDGSAEMEGTR